MATLWKLVLLIAGFGSCVQVATHNYRPLRYTLQPPSIRAFRPEGLKVSIPHTKGLQLFTFHANINAPLEEENGAINGVTREVKDDRWAINSSVKLQVGDVLYYSVFVVKNNLGYRLQDRKYEITELHDYDDSTPSTTTTTTATPAPISTITPDYNHQICVSVVLNLTQSVFDSQKEIDSLKDTNSILRDILGKLGEESRTLTLGGVSVKDSHLDSIVQAIIYDKLHLPFCVENVRRTTSGLVKFQVGSVDEKVEVVKAAREKLKFSRFSIAY